MSEIKTFSRDKLDQQDEKWVEADKDEAVNTPVPPVQEEDTTKAAESDPLVSQSPIIRPPSIVTETRIPNALIDDSKLDPAFCTMVVIQGDDPDVVADQLAILRRRLTQEVKNDGPEKA